MNLAELIKSKTLKGKEKVETISQAILTGKLKVDELIKVASTLKKAEKGTCVEALEYVTRTKPELASQKCFSFAVESLKDEDPRVKWEAAKIIGNLAPHFKTKLSGAISGLLTNTEDPGTVVRWSAAFALSSIVVLKTKHNAELIPAIEAILKREENNAMRKMYLGALKKVQKV